MRTSAVQPCASAICSATRISPARAASRVAGDSVRSVPSIVTSPGTMLYAEPAAILVIDSTAGSVTAIVRATKLLSAVTISQATGIGSIPSCGIAAWPPLPVTVMLSASVEASNGPARLTTRPAGMLGEMWSANAASGRATSRSPSSIMKRAP